jgi:hypothetical protein
LLGWHSEKIRNQIYLSRVDIELINEQIKLFYSAQDVVTIEYDEDSFTIVEYIPLGLNDKCYLSGYFKKMVITKTLTTSLSR